MMSQTGHMSEVPGLIYGGNQKAIKNMALYVKCEFKESQTFISFLNISNDMIFLHTGQSGRLIFTAFRKYLIRG